HLVGLRAQQLPPLLGALQQRLQITLPPLGVESIGELDLQRIVREESPQHLAARPLGERSEVCLDRRNVPGLFLRHRATPSGLLALSVTELIGGAQVLGATQRPLARRGLVRLRTGKAHRERRPRAPQNFSVFVTSPRTPAGS